MLCRFEQQIIVGISKHRLSNKNKIKEPEIAGTAVFPDDDTYGLENLKDVLIKDVLTMDAWREYLSPKDICALRSLLP